MAKSISEEELQLRKRARRRLIGAIALVTIVAVFLPMVLDHEPKPVNQDINIQIPSQEAGTFTSKIVPVTPGSKPPAKPASEVASAPAPRIEVPPAPKAADSKAEPILPPGNDPEAAPPKKAVEPVKKSVEAPKAVTAGVPSKPGAAPTPAAPVADAKGGFVVQVAALNDAPKAKQLQQQISGAGLRAYTEVVPTAKGSVTRVRAGPFGSRGEAEKARDKLKGMGLNGNVIPK